MPSCWPWPYCGFSETEPLSGKSEPCPAKASTDTNKVSPVTSPVPPEATMASHKELSQFASPFLNPVTLSSLPHPPTPGGAGSLCSRKVTGLDWFSHSDSPACRPASPSLCHTQWVTKHYRVTVGTVPTHCCLATVERRG